MPFVNKVRTVWTGFGGAPGYSNLYFGGSPPAQSCIDAVRDAITILQPGFNSGVTATIDPVVVTIDDFTGNVTGTVTGTQRVVVGTQSGELLPLATQGLIGFRTGIYATGREIRGRWFIPGMTETANVAAGVPSSSAILTFINAGNSLIGAVPEFVVYSRTKKASASVVSAYSPTKWAVLRSRRD